MVKGYSSDFHSKRAKMWFQKAMNQFNSLLESSNQIWMESDSAEAKKFHDDLHKLFPSFKSVGSSIGLDVSWVG